MKKRLDDSNSKITKLTSKQAAITSQQKTDESSISQNQETDITAHKDNKNAEASLKTQSDSDDKAMEKIKGLLSSV